ncbi:MAG: hypothetical protein RMK02_06430 [Burkholderiales bacterium]|nr:hypothetical protein [Burkholderiales bacterium]
MLASNLIAQALSRLLAHDEGARALLKPHAGETLRFRTPPFEVKLRVTEAGTFVAADSASAESGSASEPSVSVELPLSALPLWAQGEDALLRAARITGQAALLRDLSSALRSLPLAAEAELERYLGPILANEVVRFLRALKGFAESAQESLRSAAEQYLKEEARLVPTREEVAQFAAEVQRLRLEVDRLRARVARLA